MNAYIEAPASAALKPPASSVAKPATGAPVIGAWCMGVDRSALAMARACGIQRIDLMVNDHSAEVLGRGCGSCYVTHLRSIDRGLRLSKRLQVVYRKGVFAISRRERRFHKEAGAYHHVFPLLFIELREYH